MIEHLLAQCRADHDSWINGHPSGYVLPEDATLMGALGGSTQGGARTAARQSGANSTWQSGSGDVELLSGGVAGDVVWLVMIERASVEFTGHSGLRRWDLRVTELFRRTVDGWERFHRHADPLVDGHPLDEMLALLN